MVAGLEEITDGEIRIGDRIVNDLTPKERNIAMVFQSYALYPHMTVEDNLAFSLKLHKMPKKEVAERVQRAANILQIEDFLKRKPRALSGGQRQRVAMGRAIVREPDAFLMDEPLSNLDAQLRLAMRIEIRRLHQSLNLTTIYVTHDQEEALSMADRLVVLRDGLVQQIGTPDEVYAQPANRYVAGFMGYRNMLTFDVESTSSGNAVLAGEGVRLTGRTFGSLETKRAVAAIRPEDIIVEGPPPNRVDVTVDVVEYHGREILVGARMPGGESLYFRTEKRLAAGDKATVSVPAERVLVYPSDAPAAPQEAAI